MATINYRKQARWFLHGLSYGCIGIAGLLLWLNSLFNWQSDWTYGARNTLSSASQALLAEMEQPLLVEAYFDSDAQIREQVRRFVGRYQRFKSDVNVRFVDTLLGSEELAKQGFTNLGQVKIGYTDKQTIISRLSEESFTGALFKLTRQQEPWVAVLQGHGERDPLDNGTNGLSKFTKKLQQVGIHVQSLNLLNHAVIPDNTKVLMIAGARNAYLAGELQLIEDYLQRGGNLLWLREPTTANYYASLDTLLGINQIPGVVIDANTRLRVVLGIKHPAVIPVVDYQPHIITASINTHSLFPFTSAFTIVGESTWQTAVLFSSLDRTWAEVSELNKEELSYEESLGDTRGPLQLGLALNRNIDTIEQRAVVIGDSDFLANGYLGHGANLELGLNIINWLTQDEDLMAITPRTAPDQTIELSDRNIIFIGTLLLLVIPVVLITTGFVLHWLRNRK